MRRLIFGCVLAFILSLGLAPGFALAPGGAFAQGAAQDNRSEIEREVVQCRKTCFARCGAGYEACLRKPAQGGSPQRACLPVRAACERQCVQVDCAT